MPPRFFEKLPQGLEVSSRMLFEALQFNEEMLQLSFARLAALSDHVVSRSHVDFTASERSSAFIDAWSIVDRMHNIREVLRSDEYTFPGEHINDFLEATSAVSKLRNKMDHLHGNIKNLAEKAKAGRPYPPLLGIIEFSWQRDPPVLDEGRPTMDIVLVLGSSVHHSLNNTIGKNLALVERRPCDRFILHAFDLDLNLSMCSLHARQFCDLISEVVASNFAQAIAERKARQRPTEHLEAYILPPTTLLIKATAPEKKKG